MYSDLRPITLTGTDVRLEPLAPSHAGALWEAVTPGNVFRWFPQPVASLSEMDVFVTEALNQQKRGEGLPFVIIALPDNHIVGSTRFANIVPVHRRLEIGWTFVASPWQRTAINTETKLLLLSYAFETLVCVRVEFKTDSRNLQSQHALIRLGAREEGTLRNHMTCKDGTLRHTVYFSIIHTEWENVKGHLLTRLHKGNNRASNCNQLIL